MKVRELIRHLLEADLDSDVSAINVNDPTDEFTSTSDIASDVTSVVDLDGMVAVYYIGDRPRPVDDDES
jgi:hypothetical protein